MVHVDILIYNIFCNIITNVIASIKKLYLYLGIYLYYFHVHFYRLHNLIYFLGCKKTSKSSIFSCSEDE